MDARTERQLVEACLAGERAAWTELLRRHDRRVSLVLLRTLGTANAAEVADLRQEVWARLLVRDRAALRALRLENEGALPAFLAQVALRVAIDHGRAKGSRPQPGEGLEAVLPLAAPGASVEARFEEEEQRRALATAFEKVTAGPQAARDRFVLSAHYQDGLSPAEISRAGCGLSPKGVETLLRRARERLHALLAGPETGGAA